MTVGFSNYDAACAMAGYLIGRGYKNIGFVSLPIRDNDRAAERRAGFLAAHHRRGLIPDPGLLLESPPGLRSGGLALGTLIERVPAVDAVFLSGDVLATGALLEANRRGLDVPNRIAIVGSDDNELQEAVSPPLTTLRFPRYQIGRRAAEMLMERLRNRSHDISRLDLGYEIIERASA
jgi:LacI family gluconate utilization system Gnt-I transcriptional repressor